MLNGDNLINWLLTNDNLEALLDPYTLINLTNQQVIESQSKDNKEIVIKAVRNILVECLKSGKECLRVARVIFNLINSKFNEIATDLSISDYYISLIVDKIVSDSSLQYVIQLISDVQQKEKIQINLLIKMWLKLKDNEGARGLTRRALFEFFFSEFESYELKMSSRMIFLQMMRDPRTPFEE